MLGTAMFPQRRGPAQQQYMAGTPHGVRTIEASPARKSLLLLATAHLLPWPAPVVMGDEDGGKAHRCACERGDGSLSFFNGNSFIKQAGLGETANLPSQQPRACLGPSAPAPDMLLLDMLSARTARTARTANAVWALFPVPSLSGPVAPILGPILIYCVRSKKHLQHQLLPASGRQVPARVHLHPRNLTCKATIPTNSNCCSSLGAEHLETHRGGNETANWMAFAKA